MVYLALGFALLAVLVWAGRGGLKPSRGWRFLSGAAAVALLTAGAYAAIRNAWPAAIGMVLTGLALAASTRSGPANRRPPPRSSSSRMSLSEARAILGVDETATRDEIKAAYARLMRLAHPDKGGTDGLAAQLNAARDRLLDG